MRTEKTKEEIADLEKEHAKKVDAAREFAIQNAMAYNKHLTHAWLEQKTNAQLLPWCHPLERFDLQRIFNLKIS